jgi:hypothetical protein
VKKVVCSLCYLCSIAPSRGIYPGVFDYKFDIFPEAKNLHYWLLLLWDRIIVRVAFHDPTCTCPTCTPDRPALQEATPTD